MKKPTPKKTTSRKSQADQPGYERLAAMTDEDIDLSDIPEATAGMFAHGVVRRNFRVLPRKKEFPVMFDSEVYWWYLKPGPGYDTRINSVLRAYMEEHERNRP